MRSAIIYRIEYKEDPNIRYIASTLQELKYRWRDHKMAYKGWLKNKDLNKVAIFPFFEKHGLENFTITTIKNTLLLIESICVSMNCECGKQTNAHALKSHLKTKFHQKYLESLSN